MKPLVLSLVFPLCIVTLAKAQAAQPASVSMTARETAFSQQMTGCRMVGRFTTDGKDGVAERDSYHIRDVTKVGDDRWRIRAAIEYGTKSATVPVMVDVKWAGDTPMLQVTDLSIPFFGTYSARVVIQGDRYAGLWSGKTHGGHMFGNIEQPQEKTASQKTNTQSNWPSWRGPGNRGIGTGNPPIEWSETSNIRFKKAVPGVGISSPIIWGERIYLTTAIPTDEDGEAPAAPAVGRRPRGSTASRKVHEFAVIALERRSGDVAWQKIVRRQVPHERGHNTASQASNSPVTDGERIYAHFGSRGLHCLDMQGNVAWSKDYGLMHTSNAFGEGSSPALHEDKLVVVWDHEGDSFIVCLDKTSGKEIWRRRRDEGTSWATPLVVLADGRPQAVVPGARGSIGYDLQTGKEIWTCSGMTRNCIPTPLHDDDTVYLMSGFQGNALQALRLAGAKGDITTNIDNVLWLHARGCSYTPSGLLYQGRLYFLRTNSGRLSCLDAKTGKVHYEGINLQGARTVYSSPVAAAGRVYISAREGITKVIAAGDTYKELASNKLDDTFDATAAIVGDEIFLRGRQHLYCISTQPPARKAGK